MTLVDNIGRIQTVADALKKLKVWIPLLSRVPWSHSLAMVVGLGLAVFGCALYLWPESIAESRPEDGQGPNLIATTYSADLVPGINKSVFVVHFRNDATSPLGTARSVFAHIGYRRQDGQGMQVDYGGWMENTPTINIDRGQTKRLIVALTDEGKNFAVNFTGPRTNFLSPELVSVAELSAGQWMMVIKLNAENYQKMFYFLLTVEQNAAVLCRQISKLLW